MFVCERINNGRRSISACSWGLQMSSCGNPLLWPLSYPGQVWLVWNHQAEIKIVAEHVSHVSICGFFSACTDGAKGNTFFFFLIFVVMFILFVYPSGFNIATGHHNWVNPKSEQCRHQLSWEQRKVWLWSLHVKTAWPGVCPPLCQPQGSVSMWAAGTQSSGIQEKLITWKNKDYFTGRSAPSMHLLRVTWVLVLAERWGQGPWRRVGLQQPRFICI